MSDYISREAMSETPKCPYCGDRMKIRVSLTTPDWGLLSAQYKCMTCESTSPRIEFSGGTSNEKIIERLQAAAMRRVEPKNRVLTLDEIRGMQDNNQCNWVLIWIESQSEINTKEYCLVQGCIQYIVDNEFSFVYPDWEGNDLFRAEVYKKTWRCWLRRPTEKERETVLWEK